MLRRIFLVAGLALTAVATTPLVTIAQAAAKSGAHVVAATPEEAGAYLLIIGNCHDCHTPNWVESKGKVGKDSLMTGRALGFLGPWGTNYSKNLRAVAAKQSEDHWVEVMKTADEGDGNLPMPWHNTALMSDEDLRATYKYVKSLGAATVERIPRNAKPGAAPTSAYIDLRTKQPPPKDSAAKKP